MQDSAAPPAVARPRARHRRPATAAFVIGIVVLGFSLRGAITSLPPLFPELSSSLHLSSAAIAVLAATPVLCFGVFSGVAAPLSRRYGEERVLLLAVVLLCVGLVGRGALEWLLFPGTVLAAAAIALMNVLLPSLVKRRQPDRAGLLIGAYLASLAAGAILASLIAVPMFQASGGSVPLALGVWALPAALAALVWLPQWRFRTAPAATPLPAQQRLLKVSRHPLAWQVMVFMGLQSLIYYATLSWLPTMFRDRGADAVHAGTLLALMNLGNAVTLLLIPVLAHRTRDQRRLVALTVAATVAGLTGAWWAPLGSAPAWVLLLGLGQGAALALAIYFTVARAPDPVTSASLSAFAQGAGYLVATAGPLVVGFLHTTTGSWTLPVVVMLGIVAAELVAGWPAGRPGTLPGVPG